MADERPHGTRPATLAEEAYGRLLADILACRISGGTIVQERRLALSLGVSRSPLRDALGRLEGEGLLVRLSPRLLGVRVVTLSDHIQALDVRALLEPQAAALAATGLSAATLDRLDAGQRRLETDAGRPATDHWAFDDLLHDALAEAAANPVLALTIRTMRRWTTIYERQTMPYGLRPGTAGHRTVLDALALRDAGRTRAAMAEHIAEVRGIGLAGF